MREDRVRRALDAVPVDEVMALLGRLVGHDRYQASAGIHAAAALIAQAARDAGLSDVAVLEFPADGEQRFWTFVSARGWTPRTARLRIAGSDGSVQFDHADQPFLLATYSAPTARPLSRADAVVIESCAQLASADAMRDSNGSSGAGALKGKVALICADAYADPQTLPALRALGAIGFVTDGPCCVDPDTGIAYSGRIELDPWTDMFGFSLTHAQFADARARIEQGAWIETEIDIDRDATMPVVSAILPANAPEAAGDAPAAELWVTSHLCHPRPGANDNGSGVVGLLGAALALRALAQDAAEPWPRRRRPIRFVWAPEFVGTAAFYAHRLQCAGQAAVPEAVLNLDMIGEDQARCGSPFVIERSPVTRTSLLVPVAEAIVDAVFSITAADGGRWRPSPFLGYSDHALFAGPHFGCAAVQFAHWPDRFNHSAADTLDKVSALEMRRSIAAAALLLTDVASDYAELRTEMPALVDAWCLREAARTDAAAAAAHDPDWHAGFVQAMRSGHAHLRRLADALATGGRPGEEALDTVGGTRVAASAEARVLPKWPGPFNLRAMIGDAPEPLRAQAMSAIRRDKSTLAWLANIAVHLDGTRSRSETLLAASHAMRRPWDPALADLLWRLWLESGWAQERD